VPRRVVPRNTQRDVTQRISHCSLPSPKCSYTIHYLKVQCPALKDPRRSRRAFFGQIPARATASPIAFAIARLMASETLRSGSAARLPKSLLMHLLQLNNGLAANDRFGPE